MNARRAEQWISWTLGLAGPAIVTAVLVNFSNQIQRDYVFIYLGLVAVVGVFRGLWPALVCAAFSFLLVDYFFVPPVGTLTIADEQEIVNLVAFLATAGLVGWLGSRRRTAQLHAEALARQLQDANSELIRLNKEQAEAATAALRLARSEQQIKALQESDRLRRELLANVSHELRTPLGTILTESTAARAGPRPMSCVPYKPSRPRLAA
jgi:two-component system sensor histidine kinase KdpD